MKLVIRSLPNILTTLNLTAGIIGVLYWQHHILLSASCVFIAMIFDFFDGLSARLLNATSAIGKELDSLADMISFGLLPACILFGSMHPDFYWLHFDEIPKSSFLVFLIPIFSAFRLAKFNTDTTQESVFLGLPTPANAFLLASIPFIIRNNATDTYTYMIFTNQTSIIVLSVICSLLLVIRLPLLSLKMKSLKWKENKYKFIFIVYIAICFAVFGWLGSPMAILGYIIISILNFVIEKNN
jgi:CDP-diacylglycerol--serine O-phosphatidyltransferase